MSAEGSPRLAVRGITFDFGNTLVRVDRAGLRAVVDETAAALVVAGAIDDPEAFVAGWRAERDRQFRLQVPRLLELDLAERVRHVLAGLRCATVPVDDTVSWDERAVSERVDDAEIGFAVETYSEAFVARMPPMPAAQSVIETAERVGFRLGVLSNWPLARTIDRYLEAHGWARWFDAIVVSQRVGVIKPHPAIFRAAERAMGLEAAELLHVGDDWAADVEGGTAAGWHVAYLRGHQGDTPLPTSAPRDGGGRPDLELDGLEELLPRLELARADVSAQSSAAAGRPGSPR